MKTGIVTTAPSVLTGPDAGANGCVVLGQTLAVGESAVDEARCVECTCHAPGEPGWRAFRRK